jgi:hypothetical protein
LHHFFDSRLLHTRFLPPTGREFEEALIYVSRYWLPAKSLVAAAVAARHEVDASGRIIKLPQVYVLIAYSNYSVVQFYCWSS